MLLHTRLATRRMKECATKCLSCRIRFAIIHVIARSVVLASTSLTLASFRTWPLSSVRITLLACLTVPTVDAASLARWASGLVDSLGIRNCRTIVWLCIKELLGTILLLDGGVVVRDALLGDVTRLLHQELLVLQIGSCVVWGVEGGGARGFAVVESVVFHMNLNFLGLSWWPD